MTFYGIFILLAAGFFGGLANSLAGGASLVTFPALLALGLPPVIANASNTLALLPANFMGAYADRLKLPDRDYWFWLGICVALTGGTIGAVLLLYSSDRFFSVLVPLLIGTATFIFAFGKSIQRTFAHWIGGSENPKLRSVLLLPAAIYGGYFGAGVGVMYMALLGATSSLDLRQANANKNVWGFLSNFSAMIIFVWQGLIDWPVALMMLPATAAGGLVGTRLFQVMPATIVRRVIISIGTLMTGVYAYRYWL